MKERRNREKEKTRWLSFCGQTKAGALIHWVGQLLENFSDSCQVVFALLSQPARIRTVACLRRGLCRCLRKGLVVETSLSAKISVSSRRQKEAAFSVRGFGCSIGRASGCCRNSSAAAGIGRSPGVLGRSAYHSFESCFPALCTQGLSVGAHGGVEAEIAAGYRRVQEVNLRVDLRRWY